MGKIENLNAQVKVLQYLKLNIFENLYVKIFKITNRNDWRSTFKNSEAENFQIIGRSVMAA